ncbi:hypothetical protein BKA81DRAFT_411176 [Phyllosticta paracitricarpa]|uniref:Uncharacterized protein n=2 Tax=Phyllosticta TaxID=121621 RepID=A0ABR1L4Y5_9PEZI
MPRHLLQTSSSRGHSWRAQTKKSFRILRRKDMLLIPAFATSKWGESAAIVCPSKTRMPFPNHLQLYGSAVSRTNVLRFASPVFCPERPARRVQKFTERIANVGGTNVDITNEENPTAPLRKLSQELVRVGFNLGTIGDTLKDSDISDCEDEKADRKVWNEMTEDCPNRAATLQTSYDASRPLGRKAKGC